MSSTSSHSMSSFVVGSLTTLMSVWLYNHYNSIKNNGSRRDDYCRHDDETTLESKNSSDMVMDHSMLDGRILRKAEAAIQGRTSRLVIVVERCTNDYNYSAILRSAEALGVQNVYIIAPQGMTKTLVTDNSEEEELHLMSSTGQKVQGVQKEEIEDRAKHHLFAQRATQWLTVHEFETTQECVDCLRKQGYALWVTDLSQLAVRLESTNDDLFTHAGKQRQLPSKLAIVFGTEAVGCTAQMLEAADKRVYLPLRGFADSLNLSVATALVVHQIFILDPTLMGAMSEEERNELRKHWFPKLARSRLLTTGQKKETQLLRRKIENAMNIVQKEKNGQKLQSQQMEKRDKLPEWHNRLAEIEQDLDEKALMSVQEFIDHPLSPISDMRRADEHRTSYVGKNTKKQYKEIWGGMAATNYYNTTKLNGDKTSTSHFFRSRSQTPEVENDKAISQE
eukprot:CAMPEP_0197836638 /NCGR_PEP_ID=MMETSP1437-20131217/29579_1 /TAXON_ID=49252 ORGANISM="Eucampia antarctica, Strain CCMP1452" /NCGR_SAMPLE_ID=MMETSP1437 /ASSEMBLY_ACC=CAM_ASM_001096 /LENGTH=449 /DNA_ID=CAMNT_0043442971 /DNA_START=52 /DNA_END=1401 /DNA_ORIENTATION=+